ncbi:hypothetical protein, partial [Vibrio barjaei]|uniref:hypothetical protein n=1 Tax=Vibrio barjaei TaxID=1676683 RepID=UPI0022844E88
MKTELRPESVVKIIVRLECLFLGYLFASALYAMHVGASDVLVGGVLLLAFISSMIGFFDKRAKG